MGTNASKPEEMHKTIHPALQSATINKKTGLLELEVDPGAAYSHWRDNLHILMPYHKHLLVPSRFAPSAQSDVCCSESQEFRPEENLYVEYEPYIYTLRNEITVRKMSNRPFREHELWKLLKAAVLALRDWQKAYPDLEIGAMVPQNFLFNQQGSIKIVHRFAFPAAPPEGTPQPYVAPENRANQVIKFSDKVSPVVNRNTLSGTYGCGVALLEAACLEQQPESRSSTGQKKQFLDQSPIYTLEIKKAILAMCEEDMSKRASIEALLCALRQYKEGLGK